MSATFGMSMVHIVTSQAKYLFRTCTTFNYGSGSAAQITNGSGIIGIRII